jgi:hypothetical protein
MNFKLDFLGIGPAKAGTTWIGHMLDAHPQICMAEPKEVHFFNDSLSVNRTYSKSHFPLGYEWYAQHFKHCTPGQLKGEITPRYFIDPVVPKRVFDHNPDIKLIVCLRNPFDRIVSQYHHTRDFHHSETRTLTQAIREDFEYIDVSLHYKHIRDYLQYFKLDQFYFAEMDTIKNNPEAVISGLYAFLGVDPAFIPQTIREKSNPARGTRSVKFRKFTTHFHRALVSGGMSPFVRTLKELGLGKLINRLNSHPIEKVKLTPEDRAYIREKITSDVEQLSKLLGKDYTHWLK